MDDLRARLSAKSTPELVEILHDRDSYRAEVLPIVEALLRDRGVDPDAVGDEEDEQMAGDGHDLPEIELVLTLGSMLEAELCRSALGSAGLQAWLSTDPAIGALAPLMREEGVGVLVRAEDVEAATEILQDLQAGGAALDEESDVGEPEAFDDAPDTDDDEEER